MEYRFHGCSERVSTAHMLYITTEEVRVIHFARGYTEVDPCINSSYEKHESEFKPPLPNTAHSFAVLRDKCRRLTLMLVLL